jgi:hypothetical protein
MILSESVVKLRMTNDALDNPVYEQTQGASLNRIYVIVKISQTRL